jgi:hypothetical protein
MTGIVVKFRISKDALSIGNSVICGKFQGIKKGTRRSTRFPTFRGLKMWVFELVFSPNPNGHKRDYFSSNSGQ